MSAVKIPLHASLAEEFANRKNTFVSARDRIESLLSQGAEVAVIQNSVDRAAVLVTELNTSKRAFDAVQKIHYK